MALYYCSQTSPPSDGLKLTTPTAKIAGTSYVSSASRPQAHLKKSIQLSLKPPPILTLFIRPSKPHHPKIAAATTVKSLFTGIVEEMGTIKHLGFATYESFTMKIEAKTVLEGVHLGDSISVNGTCLTVTEFSVGLSPETLRKTNLGELKSGSLVNLERAVCPRLEWAAISYRDTWMVPARSLAYRRRAIRRDRWLIDGGRFHVDGTGEIIGLSTEGDSMWVKVRVHRDLLRYIVPKGFIAVDGTSLTVVDVFDDECCFNFMLVAYTQQKVVIPMKKVGDKVNLEVDILGKYVERLLGSGFVDSFKSS